MLPISQALELAEQQQLDLVEVSPTAIPPVCRIMDYGKFKYQQSKKLQEAKKKQVHVLLKEVKLRPKTDSHDLEFKINNVKRFLEEGNKAKITLVFRGRVPRLATGRSPFESRARGSFLRSCPSAFCRGHASRGFAAARPSSGHAAMLTRSPLGILSLR